MEIVRNRPNVIQLVGFPSSDAEIPFFIRVIVSHHFFHFRSGLDLKDRIVVWLT